MTKRLVLWKEFLDVGDYSGYFLRVLRDAAELFLVEVRRDLLAQQYLTDDIAEVRRPSAIF